MKTINVLILLCNFIRQPTGTTPSAQAAAQAAAQDTIPRFAYETGVIQIARLSLNHTPTEHIPSVGLCGSGDVTVPPQ